MHIDSDEEYIKKCEEYYKKNKIKYYTYKTLEKDIDQNIIDLISKYNPKIVVITGHDAYYANKKDDKYKNSKYYINAVKKIRKVYKEHNDLIIIAGACQSDFKGLMTSGATFASSPGHINIHALDPSIVAAFIALHQNNSEINIDELISSTKCGSDGIGGLIINGTLMKGFPRKDNK